MDCAGEEEATTLLHPGPGETTPLGSGRGEGGDTARTGRDEGNMSQGSGGKEAVEVGDAPNANIGGKGSGAGSGVVE